jgi:ferredoxin
MAYKITDDCISCAACEPECPNKAISEAELTYTINPDRCTQCVGAHKSSRCAEVCPVDACVPDPDRPETAEQLLHKWRRLHPQKEPAAGTY